MRYNEFRDRLESALQEAGLFFRGANRPVETIDLVDTRTWDDSDRRLTERDPHDDLVRLARRFKAALEEWIRSVSELAAWIRYTPPPPGAKPVEPWFDDQSEDDDDGGPQTTH